MALPSSRRTPRKWPFLVVFEVKIAVLTPWRPIKVDGGYGNRSWVVSGGCGAHLGALAHFWVVLWSSSDPAKHLADPLKWPFLVDFEVRIAVLTPWAPPKVDDGYGNWSWVVLGGCGAYLDASARFWIILWSSSGPATHLADPRNSQFWWI